VFDPLSYQFYLVVYRYFSPSSISD